MIEWAGTRITDGTERADRVVAALQSDYFHVDELLFTDLLAMAAELAANIRFYDLKNAVSGSWSELFTADEAVIMAMILSVDLKHAEAEFSQCCPGSTQNLGRYVLGWLKRINFWISKLNKLESRSAVQLRQKLNMLVREKLASELYAICSILEHLQQDSGSELDSILAEFVPIWGIVQQGESYRYPRLGQDELGQEQHKPRLHRAFYTLHNAIAYLRTLVPSYLRESLSSQRHAPAIGLFMAFLKLYERAQQQINQFSRRHLHFYYHGVLKAEPRDQRAESVYLCFAAKPGTDGALIKRATRFTAGKDQALKDIVYRTDSDLLVTDARIVSLYTLLLQHDRLISPEAQLGFVTRIKTITPPIPEMGAEQASLSSWPLFGGDTREIGSQDAKIGFAVASPLLLLREGERRIELNLWLQDSSSRDAGSLIQGLSKAVDREAFLHGCGKLFSRYLLRGAGWLNHEQRQRLTQMLSSFLDEASAKTIKGLFEEDREWLFYKLMRNAFSLQLTIAEGWQEIADFVVTPLSDPDTTDQVGIKIIFVLEQEISPISPWTAAVHGDRFDTEHPVLRCRINPRSNFYPYSLIQDFVIDKLEIQVDVKGLKTILAYNNHGQLDPSKPFQPFGPLPTCNSYLVIGNYEIATKRLSDLKLNLEWGELPIAEGGLGDYYRHYPGDYRNASFKGRFEALVDGQWRDREGEKARTVRLFSDACPVTGGRQQRRLDVNLCDDLKPADR
ncbi:MAG: hypothetical protein PVG22_16410, partial [Chromatiales bacterium]